MNWGKKRDFINLFAIINFMAEGNISYSPEEKYELIGKLIEEIKLRKYSYQTGKSLHLHHKRLSCFRQNAKRISAIIYKQK